MGSEMCIRDSLSAVRPNAGLKRHAHTHVTNTTQQRDTHCHTAQPHLLQHTTIHKTSRHSSMLLLTREKAPPRRPKKRKDAHGWCAATRPQGGQRTARRALKPGDARAEHGTRASERRPAARTSPVSSRRAAARVARQPKSACARRGGAWAHLTPATPTTSSPHRRAQGHGTCCAHIDAPWRPASS